MKDLKICGFPASLSCNHADGHGLTLMQMIKKLYGWLQKGKKLGEGGEAAAKSAPVAQWKVYDVRNLEEALLQHGEGRTESIRKAVSNFMHILCKALLLMTHLACELHVNAR